MKGLLQRRGVGPEELDLGRRLFEILEGRLRRLRARLAVDREVEVEPIFERPAQHRPAVEPRQVDVATREAVEGVREAAVPTSRDEGRRALGRWGAFPWPHRRALLDDDEPRPIFGIVL